LDNNKNKQVNRTVYINGRFLLQPRTGVQRLSREILNALDLLLDEADYSGKKVRWICLTPRGQFERPDWKNIDILEVGRTGGNLWEQIELPWFARRGLLIGFSNVNPLFHFNQLVTLCDASVFAVPEAYSWKFIAKHRIVMLWLARTARKVFTISEFSKRELSHYCSVPESRFKVILLGGGHIMSLQADQTIFERAKIGDKPYLLAVGSNSPHKNLAVLLEAVKMIDPELFELIIVGGDFPAVFQNQTLKLPVNVRRAGEVNDRELKALYKRAVCLVFPSLYEGFGLPPLEAMNCGCPVIVSQAASLPEVCGQAVLYCDPHSPADIADKICRVIKNPVLQDELRQKGYQQAARFCWKDTARTVLDTVGCYWTGPCGR
jgi:glycosyltransferase involved in cell wall biosynthesis